MRKRCIKSNCILKRGDERDNGDRDGSRCRLRHFFQKMSEDELGLRLIVFAYAVMNHRPVLKKSILRVMPANYDDNHFTNYFYRNGAAINLCVPDNQNARYLAHLYNVSHIIYFGYNSDPVELVPLDDVEFPVMAPASEPVT